MSKRRKAHELVDQLLEMPAIEALKAERKRETQGHGSMKPPKKQRDALDELVGLPPKEGPYEGATFIVKCQVCRHTFGFINQRQAQLKLADMRRAMVTFVSRAVHKFLD